MSTDTPQGASDGLSPENKPKDSKSLTSTWLRVPRFDINIRASKITYPVRLRLLFVKGHKSFDVDGHAWCLVKYKIYKGKTYVLKVRKR